MTPESLRLDLLELGVSDEAFACFLSEDVRLVRRWLSGETAIPPWLRMSVSLLHAFMAGVRKGAKGSENLPFGGLISASELKTLLDRRSSH